MDFTRISTSFYSSKGFGNGFVSQTERFNDSNLFYSKYTPGPGDYQPQKRGSIVDDVIIFFLFNILLLKNIFD